MIIRRRYFAIIGIMGLWLGAFACHSANKPKSSAAKFLSKPRPSQEDPADESLDQERDSTSENKNTGEDPSGQNSQSVDVSRIELRLAQDKVKQGDQFIVEVTAFYESQEPESVMVTASELVTWKVETPDLVKMIESAPFTGFKALGAGKARLMASFGDQEARIEFVILDGPDAAAGQKSVSGDDAKVAQDVDDRGTVGASSGSGDSEGEGAGAVVDKGASACETELAYDPTAINCAVSVGDSSSVWNQTVGWDWVSNKFVDRSADWISPLARVDNFCPEVPGVEKLIYVSHFTLARPSQVFVETMIDNYGVMRFWKDGDPKQVTVAFTLSALQRGIRQLDLAEGDYTVIIDGMNQGGTSAMITSIRHQATNEMILHTKSSEDWCIFRADATVNIDEFVPKVARCRSCFGGAMKSP